jgi:hypothetical protein
MTGRLKKFRLVRLENFSLKTNSYCSNAPAWEHILPRSRAVRRDAGTSTAAFPRWSVGTIRTSYITSKNNTKFFKTTGRIYKFYKKSIQQAMNVLEKLKSA